MANAAPSWSGVPENSIRCAMASDTVSNSTMRASPSLWPGRAHIPNGKDANASPTLLGNGVICSNTSDDTEHVRLSLRHLEQPSRALTTANAHRYHDEFCAPSLALDQRVPGHPRARHAIRMPDRDRAAIDVQPVRIDAEPVAAIDHLAGECLVQLPQSDVVHPKPVLVQQLRDGEHRADAHLVRRAAGHRHTAIDAQRVQAAALCLLRLHEHRSG